MLVDDNKELKFSGTLTSVYPGSRPPDRSDVVLTDGCFPAWKQSELSRWEKCG